MIARADRARRARAVTATGPHPTAVLIRLSVALGATAGFSLGLVLLGAVALGNTASLPWASLVQVHGQVQVIGFVGLFIFGTAAQLLPGFLSRPLTHRRPIVYGGSLVAIGLIARAIAQPLDPGTIRSLVLVLSALGEATGIGLCLFSFQDLARRSIQPPDLWRSFAGIGFAFLVVSQVLNVVAVASLIGGRSVVPASLDAAIVQVELWGFVTFLTLGVSRKILPRFLLLPAPDDGRLRWGVGLYLIGVILVVAGWLLQGVTPVASLGNVVRAIGAWPQLIGVVLYVEALRLYRPATRPSGAPGVTEPARRWLRIAFGWLVIANALGAVWATRLLFGGPLAGFFEQTAERHALAQGFVMLIIVAYSARILPGFSAWAIAHPRFVEALVALITGGAALRVIGELAVTPIGATAELVAGLGGTLAVIAFLGFAVAIVRTTTGGARHR
ncbi:MAG: NnrS family protein [Chloroflexota bacterium]